MNLSAKVIETYQQTFGAKPAFVIRSPGRVNLLGEHVDYNDGWVLPAAIDRAIYVAVGPGEGSLTQVQALDLDARADFDVTSTAAKQTTGGAALPDWARYPAGVAHVLREAGLAVGGLKAVYTSDLPRAAGLSSSAAVELAFAVAWRQLGGWSRNGMDLALLCQKAENQYVGVNCGIMDQFACANGQLDRALLLDCRSLEWQTVPLPSNAAIVIANTMIRRELGKSAYNNRRAACEEAVRGLSQVLPGIKALRDVSPADFERHAGMLDPLVAKRARHVVEECDRTVKAVAALQREDVASFGAAMNESHRTLRDHYEVSCPELDAMVSAAQSMDGCYGARLTGAGFGGCAVALVAGDKAEDFRRGLAQRYQAATGIAPDIYVCRASRGAALLAE